MKIEFDSAKNTVNLEKHGVSLVDAAGLNWDTLRAKPDTRHEYREVRMIGYALMGERLYCVVFTDRGRKRRIISLRKANSKEVKAYAVENQVRLEN